MRRENSGRWRAELFAAAMTVFLLCLLLFFYFRYEKSRTLHDALQDLNGDPLFFSEESGFFREGFTLYLGRNPDLPQDVEIRYTLNGDEPTADSFLYEDGIDLTEAVLKMGEEAAAREIRKAEVIREADAAAKAAEETLLAREQAAAAGSTANNPAEQVSGDQSAKQIGGNPAEQPGEQPEKQTGGQSAEQSGEKEEASAEEKEKTSEETRPTIEDGRESWEREKWTAAADSGIRPERTEDGICVLPVRACLVQGEDRSPIVTKTYVIGENVRDRYDVYVASVVTDSYNLFDYDNGIMIPGSHYLTDVANGVREDRAGNFYQNGDEWIKSGHVTLFSPGGEVLLEEDTGLAVAGYSSRIIPTRTLRMEASKAYGTSDDYFHLDIFSDPEKGSGADTASQIDLFKKIKFRTHGIPGYHIRSVRNQYAKELTDECGFPGLTENRLGVVFLNGEFYTVCDIAPSTTADYVCRLFNLNVPDGIEKYSGSDVDVYTRTKIIKLFTADLTQEANQQALEAKVDMDNYLFYFALEVLFNNADWPFNNVTVWRYLGEENPENPCTDGRIRFLIEDMDQILTNGLHGDPTRWSDELIDYLMKDKGNTFHHVMECTRYRDRFLTYVDDLLRTAFEPDHACAVLDRLYAEMKREYILDYGEAFWKEMEDTAETTKQNVREKESLYRKNITKYMELTDRYQARIEAGEGVSVTWNNMTVSSGDTWINDYYCGTSFTVTAHPADGYRIAGWEVNGKKVSGEGTDGNSLTISDALSESGAAGNAGTAAVTVR
ncbi:MAG: CotH kinase family protein, partial [Eubacteriales bacterium]|nr:CotH kinase family protein [Eubacteriales bacterium]